jgi:GT2 family glycosyltransferase
VPQPTEPRLLGVGGTITSSCRLSDYLILLVASIDVDLRGRPTLWRFCDGECVKLDATMLSLPGSTGDNNTLLVVREPRVGTDLPAGSLVLRTAAGEMSLEPFDLETTFVHSATLARQHLSVGDDGARALTLARLLEGTANERRSRRRLSERLFEIREIVRKPLPSAVIDAAEPRTAQVDAIWRLDDTAFYVEGWVKHEGAELTSLVAMSPEGERVELVSSAFRYRRPDVAEFFRDDVEERSQPSGFIAYFELANPSLRADGWILEMRDSNGGAVEVPMPFTLQDAPAARESILADFAHEARGEHRLKVDHISPAVTRLEARRRRGVAIDSVDQHGPPPQAPEVSIIVPLYRRVEFLEQQLAQFVHDSEVAAADLIYVLDSPEDADYLRRYAHHLFRLYEVPFRLAVLTRNGGFSAVNNLGASLARGRLLLLLNSDVIPESPGWLGAMIAFYDSTPDIGALGPKLLYEDDSIQHAGMYFEQPTGSDVWLNEHFFKGLHRDLPAANVTRAVPALTGACLMIAKKLYDQLGGLSAEFVQGDYEDSDLCLRLAETGRKSWYLPTVALYHLEGQSFQSTERELVSQYNSWLHSSLWGEQIESFVQRAPASQAAYRT